MSASPWTRLGVLAVFLAIAAAILASRLSLTYDLGYFLPAPQTEDQRVLVERLGQGPGSRLLFLALPTTDRDAVDRLADALRGLDAIARVLPPAAELDPDAIPAPVRDGRYLLNDLDWSTAALRRVLEARLRDLALADDPAALALIASDPHLASLAPLVRVGGDPARLAWRTDSESFLVLETRAAAFDIQAQADAIAAVQDLVTRAIGAPATLYGAGAYGVALQSHVRSEATTLSVAASLALVVLLGAVYRRILAVVLVALPVVAGGTAGLVALALLFEQVHGITLAFGFTLLGVTVDYGVHALSHARPAGPTKAVATDAIWPTIALAALSSASAYLAFVVGGSRGLMQLGVLSAVGIAAAAFFAWYLLPPLLGRMPPRAVAERPGDAAPPSLAFRLWPALAALALGAGALTLQALQAPLWSNDLAALTPVAPETLAEDHRLRTRLGAPDIRFLVTTRRADREATLDAVAELEQRLEQAQKDGMLGGYQAVTALVPSQAVQSARRARLDPTALAARLRDAVADTPFRSDAFAPFLADVARTASGNAFVEPADYAGTELQGVLDGMLYREGDEWVALTFLSGLHDPSALGSRLADAPGSHLVDLGLASQSLLAAYRERVLAVLGIAAAVVLTLLSVTLRAPRRVLWIALTLAGALSLGSAISVFVLGSLSLFDLIATTLVAGLGLDYALFFSRRADDGAAHRHTRHALTVCVTSTGLVFTLLATSSVPVLHGIGTTVAVGILLVYLLARVGRYARPAT